MTSTENTAPCPENGQDQNAERPMQVRALCCECGRLRTLSPRYNSVGWGEAEPDARCVTWRKCATCERKTRHAWLRDGDPAADIAERKLPERPERYASSQMTEWALLSIRPLPEGMPCRVGRHLGLMLLFIDPFAEPFEVIDYCEKNLTTPEWEALSSVLEPWQSGPALGLHVPDEMRLRPSSAVHEEGQAGTV